MNLSVKKLRRSATVIGGAIAGLGIVAAMGAPALACHPDIEKSYSCVNADGSWLVVWTVEPSDTGISGTITDVQKSPASSTLTGIEVNAALPADKKLTGVQTIPADQGQASIEVTATFENQVVATKDSPWVSKPTKACRVHPSTPPTTPATTPPTTPATTAPTTTPSSTPPTVPATEPNLVYDETCTTLTVGVEVPKDWKQSETVTFTAKGFAPKVVTAKPGETKTVDYPASKGLTVTGTPKSQPKNSASITYKAPANCTSSPAPSSSGPVLAVTGSSSAPLAGGAIALVLVGGGAFFMARRRKMKFTA